MFFCEHGSYIWLFPLAASNSDKWWGAVHSEVETCARAPCGGCCAGWGGMNGGLVTPPPTYPSPHVPAQTTSPHLSPLSLPTSHAPLLHTGLSVTLHASYDWLVGWLMVFQWSGG